MRKLTRLQSLIAGTAFAAAGIFGAPAAALAADAHPTTTDQVVTEPAGSSVLHLLTNGTPATSGMSAPATSGPAATSPTSGPSASGTPASSASGSGAVVTATPAAPAAPSDADLHPMPVTAAQTTTTPDPDQLSNAKAIVQAGKDLNLPPRAWEIAVATSLQESNLHNLGNLGANNDHDSLGLFQQRTGTGGWGTPDQIMDPHHAATMFYQRLTATPGWDSMPLTQAAQKVQVSAYPQAYAGHETQAGNLIDALYGTGPYANLNH